MDAAPDAPSHPMGGHVLRHIGIHAAGPHDPCAPGMHLHLSPAVLQPDGHVDLGVLGVFVDMACSQVGGVRAFLHADISLHLLAPPAGSKLLVHARAVRRGGRSAVVDLEVVDELGTAVARSVQQLRFSGAPEPAVVHERTEEELEQFRRAFFGGLDGTCTLPAPFHDTIGLATDGTTWRMPLGPSTRNGFGGLHGGVAFALVGEAAAGAAGGRVESALLRYLAPGRSGPFRADPTVQRRPDGSAFVLVEVYDEGADDLRIVLGEVDVSAP